eukprot:symbB.v1.2.003053.t1/scaffold161.1/size290820/4
MLMMKSNVWKLPPSTKMKDVPGPTQTSILHEPNNSVGDHKSEVALKERRVPKDPRQVGLNASEQKLESLAASEGSQFHRSGGNMATGNVKLGDCRLLTKSLSVLAKEGQVEKVKNLLQDAQDASLQLDVVHWGAASRVFEMENQWRQSIAMLRRGQQIDLEVNEFIFSSVVSSCTRNIAWFMGLHAAHEGFQRCQANDFLHVGSIALAPWELALQFLEMTWDRHLRLEVVTFGATIGVCSKADHWRAAESLLLGLATGNFTPSLVTMNACCDACAGARRWYKSLAYLHAMPTLTLEANLISFNSSLSACEKGYEWEHGLQIMTYMEDRGGHLKPGIITFSSAISACEKGAQWQLAIHLLQRMHQQRLRADAVALSAAMSACEKAGQWEVALCLLQPAVASRTSMDLGCAFSAALGAAERSSVWVVALALLQGGTELRLRATGMYAGTVASSLRKACGEAAAIKFLKSSRSQWEDGPCEASRRVFGRSGPLEMVGEFPGVLMLSKAANVRTETLVDAACKQLEEDLWVVSRLDRPTSGLLPLARSLKAMNWLQAQFAARLVYKEYVCLCEGEPLGEIGVEGTIDQPLHSWNWPGEVGRTVIASFGREAITDYRVEGRFAGPSSELMLLSVHPRTGRMHQIRAHLASIQRPIVGDEIYGMKLPSTFQCERMFLHCRRLRFLDAAASLVDVEAESMSRSASADTERRQAVMFQGKGVMIGSQDRVNDHRRRSERNFSDLFGTSSARPLALCEAGRSEFHGAATASWMDATTETSARNLERRLGSREGNLVYDAHAKSVESAQLAFGKKYLRLLTAKNQVLVDPDKTLEEAQIEDGECLTALVLQPELAATHSAFALWCHGDSAVVTWGSEDYGGDSSAVRDQLKGVQQIQAARGFFAAILADGSVVTWGSEDFRRRRGHLKGLQQIQATQRAFAAILEDGSVVTWGRENYGGDSSAERACWDLSPKVGTMTSIVEVARQQRAPHFSASERKHANLASAQLRCVTGAEPLPGHLSPRALPGTRSRAKVDSPAFSPRHIGRGEESPAARAALQRAAPNSARQRRLKEI